MGEYADVKRKRVLALLKWLNKLDGFEVSTGGKHQCVVCHDTWNRPFPITFKYNIVSKVYLKELVKKVVATGACSKEEFDEHL